MGNQENKGWQKEKGSSRGQEGKARDALHRHQGSKGILVDSHSMKYEEKKK